MSAPSQLGELATASALLPQDMRPGRCRASSAHGSHAADVLQPYRHTQADCAARYGFHLNMIEHLRAHPLDCNVERDDMVIWTQTLQHVQYAYVPSLKRLRKLAKTGCAYCAWQRLDAASPAPHIKNSGVAMEHRRDAEMAPHSRTLLSTA